VPVPEPRKVFAIPTIPVDADSLIEVTLESLPGTTRRVIRVTSTCNPLPSREASEWAVVWRWWQGEYMPAGLEWADRIVDAAGFSTLLEPIPSSTYQIRLRRTCGGLVYDYPIETIAVPTDPVFELVTPIEEDINEIHEWQIPVEEDINEIRAEASAAVVAANAAVAAAASAQEAADGKIDSFWQPTAPASGSEGDLWFDTDDGNKVYRRTSGAWVAARDAGIASAISAAATAQGTADGKARIYYQATQPTGLGAGDQGDLWCDTDDNMKIYAWTGSAWVLAQDWQTANAAAQAAQNAANSANNSIASISNDDVLSRVEKSQLVKDYNEETATQARLVAEAGTLGLSGDAKTTAYNTAVSALTTFLSGLTPTWSDTSQDTPLGAGGGTTLRMKWTNIATARTDLQSRIAQERGALAVEAAATDASTKVNNALTTAANDATAKAATARTNAVNDINTAVGGMVVGATSAADAVSKVQALANTAQVLARQGGVNLIKNGNSEDPNATGIEAASVAGPWCYSGTKSRLINIPAGQTSVSHFTDYINVNPGDPIYYEAWTACDPYSGAWRQIVIDWFDANKNWISGTYSNQQPSDGWIANGSSVWRKFGLAPIVPNGASWCRFGGIGRGGDSQAGLAGFDNLYAERSQQAAVNAQNTANSALATAQSAQQIPVYSGPSSLPSLPNSNFPAGYGPVLTSSDWSLWKVNSAGTGWDRILFASTGIFGQIIASQIQVDDTLRAAVVDAPHVNATLLTLMDAKVSGGKTVIGPGSMDIDAIRARTITLTGENLIPNPNSDLPTPSGGWPAGAYEAKDLESRWCYSGKNCRAYSVDPGTWGYHSYQAPLPCSPGESFLFKAMTACDPYSGSQRQISIEFFDANGVWVSGSYSPWRNSDGWIGAGAPSFAEQSITGTCPAGAAFVIFNFLQRVGSSNSGFAAIDCMLACKQKDAAMIVDGTLTALFQRVGNDIQSAPPNYQAGTSSTPPTGFKIACAPFNGYFLGNATPQPMIAEFGGAVSIAGYKAATLADKVMNQVITASSAKNRIVSNTGNGAVGLNITITPRTTGRLRVIVTGMVKSCANPGINYQHTIKIVCGTGTPPSNGQSSVSSVFTDSGMDVWTTSEIPYSRVSVISGLNVGSTYWVDVFKVCNVATSTYVTVEDICIEEF
jgi:hypothetical protein